MGEGFDLASCVWISIIRRLLAKIADSLRRGYDNGTWSLKSN